MVVRPFFVIQLVWADGGYAGKLVDWPTPASTSSRGSSSDPTPPSGFVLPRRWVVERTWTGALDTDAACATTNDYPPTTKPWSARS